jgi:hypothetical protein
VPEYKVNVIDPSDALSPRISWKRYRSDLPLEYGNEIIIEADQADSPDAPTLLRAQGTSVDNDSFFTSTVTVEPIGEN